jgi:uncharacterized membrane protein YdjX (TVP38/TMEM64 family)
MSSNPTPADLAPWITALLEAAGPWGPVAIVAVLVVGALTFVPRPALCVAAGFAYGHWAIAMVLPGAVAGTALAFWIGRRVLRPRLTAIVAARPTLWAVARAVEEEGFRAVLLLRLGPVVPSSLLSYLLSTTSIPFRPYILATFLGIAPAICLQVVAGAAARAAVDAEVGGLLFALAAVGLLAFASAFAMIARRSRRLLATVR